MAGSYNHVTTDDGRLRTETFADLIENLGDAYEAVEGSTSEDRVNGGERPDSDGHTLASVRADEGVQVVPPPSTFNPNAQGELH